MKLPTVLAALVLCAAGIWLGYRLGHLGHPPSPAREASTPATSRTASRDASGPPLAPTGSASDARVPDSRFDEGYLDLVRAHGLAEKQARAANAFPKTATGAALARTVVLNAFRAAPGPESKLLEASLAELKSHPERAFEDLAAGIDALPPELSSEKQFLIQFGARLDVDRDRRIEFLSNELSRPAQAGGDEFSPAIALDSLAEISKDPSVVESGLRAALKAQKDPKVRQTLLSRFAAIAPERARALKQELEGN